MRFPGPVLKCVAIVAAALVLFVGVSFVALSSWFDPPRVVACIEQPDADSPTDWQPAISRVEVYQDPERKGHILERHAFGCTFYFWHEKGYGKVF
jgi:hypothetical protein